MASVQDATLKDLHASCKARKSLLKKYQDKIETNPSLSRSLVSYQSNRKRPYYRWFKYKEGFSAALVEYVMERYGQKATNILDPFAGSGAALFASREYSANVTGIELLPVGELVIQSRLTAEKVNLKSFTREIKNFQTGQWRLHSDLSLAFSHLKITQGAFSKRTEKEITCFRTYCRDQIQDGQVRLLFEFACMSILESVSYTRKDGQYLRWDHRSSRHLNGKKFDKGVILSFQDAIERQLQVMLEDLSRIDLFSRSNEETGNGFHLHQGSCFSVLPQFQDGDFDLVITSPPYCNRYDYTRTYALELAYLGVSTDQLKLLRQDLLSCTVENKTKMHQLTEQYQLLGRSDFFNNILKNFDQQDALQEVLSVLENKKEQGILNNSNVPRMVRNYFLESALVIFELSRIVRPGGYVIMVNDNVQYAGEEVPVDLILSEIASKAGFSVEQIWALERGKGNSSQQMGAHGRNELRKCAYVWQR